MITFGAVQPTAMIREVCSAALRPSDSATSTWAGPKYTRLNVASPAGSPNAHLNGVSVFTLQVAANIPS
jgi:hypothetical protein